MPLVKKPRLSCGGLGRQRGPDEIPLRAEQAAQPRQKLRVGRSQHRREELKIHVDPCEPLVPQYLRHLRDQPRLRRLVRQHQRGPPRVELVVLRVGGQVEHWPCPVLAGGAQQRVVRQ